MSTRQNIQRFVGAITLGLLVPALGEMVYSNNFDGVAGTATGLSTPYSIIAPRLYDPSYKSELDGNGHMQATEINNLSNYRVRIDDNQTLLYPTIGGIKFTAVLGVPSSNYVGVGFHGGNSAGLHDGELSINSGPWVAVYADRIVLFGGHGMGGSSNEYAVSYSPGSLVTVEMSYYFATKTVLFSVDGNLLGTGLAVSHLDKTTGLPAEPNVGWLQINLSRQDVIANGGGYADSLSIETIMDLPGYGGWARGWGLDFDADASDFDSDGLLNIYEYGLGGDPIDALDQGTPPVFGMVEVSGTNYFSYVHPQLADSQSGLNYSLELNTNLVSGGWTKAGYTVLGTNVTGNELDFVTNVTDTVENQKFARLIISKTKTLYVDNFGAVGDGVTDDIAAVADALAALKVAGSGATLEFTPGKTYRLGRWDGSMYHFDLQGMTNVTVNGNGAMLLSTPYNAPIRVQNCSHVTVKDFAIEESPLAYAQGVITYIEPTGEYFEMETMPEFPLTISLQFGYWNWGAIIDPVLKRIRVGEKDHYNVDSITALSATNTFRVTVVDEEFTRTRLKNEGRIGDIWFQPLHFNSKPRLRLIDGERGDPNIWVTQSSDILMEDISLYSGRSSMCNTINNNDGPITYRRFRVEIPSYATNRVVSVWRDGMHCKNNRVGPVIEDCYFSAMLDDSINLSQSTTWAAEVVAGTTNKTFRLTGGWVGGSHAVGDRIKVFYPATGEYVGPVAISGVDSQDPGIITLESSIPNVVVQGETNACLFYNMDLANEGAVVRGSVFMPQRRHAILLRAPKSIIENNLIDSVGGSGVSIECSGGGEGPFPEDIIVRNNCFKSTYRSPIWVYAISRTVDTSPVNHIEISNNAITVAETPAVKLANVDWISLKKNQFNNADGSELLDAVEITDSTHVFLSDTDLLDAGFESEFSDPDGNGFEFRPDGPPWTFVALAGYSEASTAFTSGNPSPPEGSQVLLLKGASRASQNLVLDAGTYTLSFYAAQRKNYGSQIQQVEVFVDGVSLGIFQPSSDGEYERFESTFTVPACGPVLLKMKSLIAADETIFLDDVGIVPADELIVR